MAFNCFDSNNTESSFGSSLTDDSDGLYNPWTHRTLLSSSSSLSTQILRNDKLLPSPNLDALVSKLIIDDDRSGQESRHYNPIHNPIHGSDVIRKCQSKCEFESSHSHDMHTMGTGDVPNQMSLWNIKDDNNDMNRWNERNYGFGTRGMIQKSQFNYSDVYDRNYMVNHSANANPNANPNANGRSVNLMNCGGDVMSVKSQNPKQMYNVSAPPFYPNSVRSKYVQQQQSSQQLMRQMPLEKSMLNNGNSHNNGNPIERSEEPKRVPQMRSIRARPVVSDSGHINKFTTQLDRCYEQLKLLIDDRKKTEAHLTDAFPGQKISSVNNIPIQRLPPNPSRIDRLVIEMSREHAKVITIVATMEYVRGNRELSSFIHETIQQWHDSIRNLRMKREELVTIKSVTEPIGDDLNEFAINQITEIIENICNTIRYVRTTLWCAYISTINEK